MPNYYVLQNNVVTNVVIAEDKENAEIGTGLTCIEQVEDVLVRIGDIYNPETDTFTEPTE